MQTFKTISAGLAVIIGIIAFYPYIRDIFLKRTRPHTYTWLIWAITQGVAVAGMWYGNAGFGALGLSIGAVLVIFVFLFSLKNGTKKITLGDTIILIMALSAIVIWWQLHNPILAVLMVCLADALGYIPSYRKSWTDPWGETVLSWVLFSIGNIFAIIALAEYNILTLSYLVTICSCNIVLIIICLIRRKKICISK